MGIHIGRLLSCVVLPLVAIQFFASSLEGTAAAQDAATEQEGFQGTWNCIATVKNGKQASDFVGVMVRFEDDSLTWIFPRKDGTESTQKGTFSLDPSQNPKHFDWSDVKTPDKMHRRIYLLAGDTILMSANVIRTETVNAPGQRPTSFNDGQYLFVLRRISKDLTRR